MMSWGNWVFDPANLTLSHSTEAYEIDLEEIHSSAALLDWIFQVRRKVWADANTMHDLLGAFRDILDPQANFCPNEVEQYPDGGVVARAFVGRAAS